MKLETLIISVIILMLAFLLGIPSCNGVGAFGPENTIEVTVNRLYVDKSKEDSHYMVGTDKGVFEVQNSIFLGIYNADELFSQLQEGKSYRITTKGNKFVGFFFQYYPYIIKVETISK